MAPKNSFGISREKWGFIYCTPYPKVDKPIIEGPFLFKFWLTNEFMINEHDYKQIPARGYSHLHVDETWSNPERLFFYQLGDDLNTKKGAAVKFFLQDKMVIGISVKVQELDLNFAKNISVRIVCNILDELAFYKSLPLQIKLVGNYSGVTG